MKRIFVDLEMHPVTGNFPKEKSIFRFETMEIGAVMLDEKDAEIDSFCEYVHLMFSESVQERYTELTGITTQMLQDADPFPAVLERFLAWCGTDYTMYSWSKSDLAQIKGECRQKGIPSSPELTYLLRNWSDFQKEFSKLIGFHHAVNLRDAVSLGGLDFDGRAHDGLVDARNTANLFRQTRDEKMFRKLKSLISEKEEPLTFTMGEVFNFKVE